MEELLSNLVSLGATPTVLLMAFFVCFVGYALGSIQVKGLNLGTAGVFLFALLFGYLCTLPGLQEIPVLGKFFMADAKDAKITSFKFLSNIGLVLFVTSVGSIAGPKFFRDLKKNAKTYVPMGALIICIGALVTTLFAMIPGIGPAYATGILSGALTSTPLSPPQRTLWQSWQVTSPQWLCWVRPSLIPSALSALSCLFRSCPAWSKLTWLRSGR